MSWRPCKLSHLVSWMSENDASGENTNGAISSVDLSSCLLVQSEHHAVSHSTSMSRLTSKHLAVHYLLIMQKSQVCYYTNGLQRHGHKGNCFWTIYRGHGYSPEPEKCPASVKLVVIFIGMADNVFGYCPLNRRWTYRNIILANPRIIHSPSTKV